MGDQERLSVVRQGEPRWRTVYRVGAESLESAMVTKSTVLRTVSIALLVFSTEHLLGNALTHLPMGSSLTWDSACCWLAFPLGLVA